MDTKIKVAATTVVFALVGFMLAPNAPLGGMIWPPHGGDDLGEPTGTEIGLLMLYGALQSVAFGLGASFLIFGAPLLRRARVSADLARLTHLSIGWLLVSWVPHDALHQHISSFAGLISLEFGFHLTLMIAGLVIARYFLATIDDDGARADVPAASATLIKP